MQIKKDKISYYVFIVLSSFYFISFFVLQTKFKDSIINIYLRQSTSILNNITEKIKNDINNYPENYRSMKELELYLPIIKTDDVSHIFIITKRENHFFYIKDFSDKDKAYPGMPFFPLKRELKVINEALVSKTPQFLVHHSINTIGFTLYYPITLNNSSDNLVILDYNLKALKNIINLENFIIYSFAAANSIIFLLFKIYLTTL